MRPHNMLEPILCSSEIPPPVRKQNSRTTHPEKAIRNQHTPTLPRIPSKAHRLRAHDDRIIIPVRLQHIPRQIKRDDPRATPHSAEVVAEYVSPHLVMIDDHGGERRRGIKEAAIDDEDSDVFGADSAFLEQFVEGAEHDGGGLRAAFFHGGAVAGGEDGAGDVGLVANAGGFQDSALKGESVFVEFAGGAGKFN